ncbi:MAG: zf-HC2 domain-containing protein [Ruminococcus flavefaciens]|nr:zf-HC2 domain-containing protein [Ruminococcus flavefaciens]MCM1229395.1 zf-HC2 domain-containing protein [Ruminococcus flavefaciens]
MKCSIIRDLLPLYCDKLTSAESNEEIENHLRSCAECAEIYENMSEGIDMTEQEKNIQPLKKVKMRFLINLICGILGTAVVLFGVFILVFRGVVPISSDKLSWTFEESSMTGFNGEVDDNGNFIENERYDIKFINIVFTGDCSCTREKGNSEYIYNDDGTITKQHHITIYPVIKLPFDDRGEYPNQYSWGFSGYNENDTLTIHCRDKDMTFYLKDLVEESGLTLE